jgi:glycosyltransferase involved in cell wall biosynthesis
MSEKLQSANSTSGTSPSVDVQSASVRPRRPNVSLCIPAFQAERHLQATIDSVLAQNYADLEVVIVDNNSSDGTRDILERLNDDRVRVIRNAKTLPIADNFNLAVQQSRGKFVKLICADDTLEPDCIAAQVEVLEASTEVALVAVLTDFIDDEGELLRQAKGLGGIVGRHSGERVVRQIVRSGTNPIGAQVATMFRRVDFDRCGGFRGDLLFPMDMDLWVRLLHHGEFFGLPRTLASYRIASESITALMPARSQLAQQIEFARRLVDDPRWEISVGDRTLGRVNCYDMQMRRTLLFLISSLRAWRRRRRAMGSIAAGTRPSQGRGDFVGY